MSDYFMITRDGKKEIKGRVYPQEYKGIKFIVHKNNGKHWNVTEVETGYGFGLTYELNKKPSNTRKGIIAAVIAKIEREGVEKVKEVISTTIKSIKERQE